MKGLPVCFSDQGGGPVQDEGTVGAARREFGQFGGPGTNWVPWGRQGRQTEASPHALHAGPVE